MTAPLSQTLVDQVKELYDQGFGEHRIAKKLNIKRGLVQRAYKILGIWGAGRRHKDKVKSRIPDQKKCSVCMEVKGIDQFRINLRKTGNWASSKCFICEREYHKNFNAQPSAKEKRRQYRAENKDKSRQYDRNKRQADPAYRLRKIVSGSIRMALKKGGSSKNGKSVLDYLPYTIEKLKEHIESQFEDWMTWDNQGPCKWDDNDPSTWTWQLDHIIPQSDLPYTSMEDENFQKCWALSNLRPLSAKQNATDGGKKTRHNNT